jgi:hypothetical protein
MSTNKIDPKNPTEVPPKDAKTELTEEGLSKVTGGTNWITNTGPHKHIAGVKYEDVSTTNPPTS